MIRISCDECVSPDIEAQIEYARGEHERLERERQEHWVALESEFGRLTTQDEWFAEGTLK